MYYDLPTDGRVRQGAFNLGAPGDRRDADETLWLNFPRPQLPIVFQPPLEIEAAEGEGLGRYHFDADRREIKNTSRSWLYTSGIRGLRRVKISLDESRPLISNKAAAPPVGDGRLAEKEWPAEPQRVLYPVHNRQNRGAPNRRVIDPANWNPQLFLQHDATNLYVAFRLPNKADRRGQAYQWRKLTSGEDTGVWSDDSYELFLSDQRRETVLHFGISASGATYDARLIAKEAAAKTAVGTGLESAVTADKQAFVAELTIPWSVLQDAGLDRETLTTNALVNWAGWSMPVRFLGSRGRLACENFTPLGLGGKPQSQARKYRLRLHFAEPDEIGEGTRRFDVRVQGRPVLSGFDVLKAAGGKDIAVVREFEHITAAQALELEFVPTATNAQPSAETILSALEIEEMPVEAGP